MYNIINLLKQFIGKKSSLIGSDLQANISKSKSNNNTFNEYSDSIPTDNSNQVTYEKVFTFQDKLKRDREYELGLRNIFTDHSFSNAEFLFFSVLSTTLDSKGLKSNLLQISKSSDGTWNVSYKGVCVVGRIRLSTKKGNPAKKTKMQYTIAIPPNKTVNQFAIYDYITENLDNPTLDECIATIPKWITYIKGCKKLNDL